MGCPSNYEGYLDKIWKYYKFCIDPQGEGNEFVFPGLHHPLPLENGNCGDKWSISSKTPPSTFEIARICKLEKCTSFTIVK